MSGRLLAGLLFVLLPLYSQTIDRLMQEGEKAREEGKLPEAIRVYRQIVAREPKRAEAWWYLGLSYYDADRYAPCVQAFQELVKLDASGGPAWAMLGLCEFSTQQYELALQHLGRARALGVPAGELSTVTRYHYVLLLNRTGQFELASGILAPLTREKPDSGSVIEANGLAVLRLAKLPGELTAELREPVRLAGQAVALAYQQRVAEAKPLGEALVAQYPQLPNAHYVLGYLLLQEHSPRALEAFKQELAVSPRHVPARLQLAYEYMQRGEAAAGLPYAQQAVEFEPENFLARNIYGRVLLAQEQFPAAIAQLERAVQLAPDSPEAHLHLATAYTRSGRKEEAAREKALFAQLEKQRPRP